MNCKNTTKEIAILLGIALATAFTFNYFTPMGIALIGQWDESQGVITAKTKNDFSCVVISSQFTTSIKKLHL